jgi:serine protease
MSSRVLSAIALSLACASAASSAQEYNGRLSEPSAEAKAPATQRLIVKWRASGGGALQKSSDHAMRAQKLGAGAGLRLKFAREIAPALDVVELEAELEGAALADALAAVRAEADVEFVEPDRRRYPHAIPSDALFANQWYLQSTQISAVRATQAWDTTTGGSGTVVAVLDTGVRYNHTDLGRATQAGKLLPGFDFISNTAMANDADARDSDPSDPGDWIDTADLQRSPFNGGDCELANSSWHGTRVSGIVGALSNNGTGIAGLGWTTWVLPVRVLGKCGGDDSDILSAMRWAAGLAVAGAPINPYPARVINLSLGADGPCSLSYVNVVNELANAGVLVVASAGNDGGSVDAPANCPGVVAVGAIRHIGTKVGFSNVGPGVALSAPGGNCVNTGPGQPCLFSIDTTNDTGTTTPVAPTFTDQTSFNVGTSFSSPIVAGTAGLMHAVNAKLPPALLTARLREGARAFPTTSTTVPAPPVCHVPVDEFDLQTAECICTTQTCGAGMLDAAGAVAAALRPAVSIQVPGTITAGQDVALNASASAAACNRTLSTFAWTLQSGSATITGADQPIATVQAPTTGEFTLRLTITDNLGLQDFAEVTVRTSSASTTAIPLLAGSACPTAISVPQDPVTPPPPLPPPSGGGGGGGGGGALGLGVLALLLGILRATRSTRARRAAHSAPGTFLD